MKKSALTTRQTLILLAAGALLLSNTALRAAPAMDTRIEGFAKISYVFKHYLADDAIWVNSRDGAVSLTGTVAVESHIGLAGDTVEALPGVKSVDNQLLVKGESPAQQSDTWLSLKVKSALLFHRNVNAAGTDVYVQDGIVSLRGDASSLAQKELTTEYARDVDNVKEVRNEMTIARTSAQPSETLSETIDDASTTALVKATLRSHRSTSALRTTIQTTEGMVTVGGMANSAAEKSLVTKLVTDVLGVTSVVNNMTVAVAAASNN